MFRWSPQPGQLGFGEVEPARPFSAKSNGGRDVQAGLDYVSELIRNHVTVVPKSGREATTAFEQGQGDVLISYENEAIMLERQNATSSKNQQVDYVLPPQTFKIENPAAVVNTSDHKTAAKAFVDFLFTPRHSGSGPSRGSGRWYPRSSQRRPTSSRPYREAVDHRRDRQGAR